MEYLYNLMQTLETENQKSLTDKYKIIAKTECH